MTSDTHPAEPHVAGISGKLNWLRAGVLGANDGIVSTAGIVVGVAAASADRGPIFTAGIAGLAAGALSMAVGEYVSVSTQRDTEKALLEKERRELIEEPESEFNELVGIYKSKGLSAETAKTSAACRCGRSSRPPRSPSARKATVPTLSGCWPRITRTRRSRASSLTAC